ncbi:putative mitochondrial protein [Trifolium repens]|nr:putative mitochondrial protein [Trifolium repens]
MKVNFTKSECLVTNEEGQLMLKGTRSKDNCYLWMPQEEAFTSTCLVTTEDEVQLWHQKLGHLNLKGMKKAMSAEAIRGLPRLKIIEGKVCGECQIGKQIRMSHPMLEHQTTSKILELLHMDLMGPIQVESLEGKRYVLVVVDDYSRYTWVNFIREKSDAFDVFKELCIQIQREKGISVDQSLYRSMIGSLLYLTASRPDITYVVGVCARYQADPKVSHLTQVKRILKYVNGTCDYGIMYSHCEDSTLYGYCDADWAGSADDRKSTSGGCFFLGTNLISWFSKKQNCVALSTAEAEYIAVGSSCSQLVWMKQMLKEYDVEQDALTLYCDNMSAINISKNPIQHNKTKHIDIRHHFIRDLVENKIVTLEHVGTKEQVADIFTKALDAVQFEKLRGKLEICLYEEL